MKLLVACFGGSDNGAYHILQKMKNYCNKLILENDKEQSCIQLKQAVDKTNYNKVVILGQKPLIKDKYCIETKGRCLDRQIKTHFKYEELVRIFEECNVCYKISDNAGTSYCNHIYYWALEQLKDKEVLFLHTPYLKNITNVENMARVIDDYVRKNYYV
ncbi:C15 family peptidase [Anaeromicropila herbilytica]|uniref:Peptidase C15 n=1 Tax=Anaeromicropila herbilytica TaxID=2785025 RepID=A0A7R7EHY5_9FIRM|nr:hypothetical protein [Anaeromicropila herbilytica]BCN29097.1 hypothetical protein bsdtb5_03920 [Anaeromicropila herbilytica]